MRQDSEARNCFFVKPGEQISVVFEASPQVPTTPIGDADRVHLAVDGTIPSKKHSAAARTVTFTFPVTENVGNSHFALFECVLFSKFDPNGSKYLVTAQGRLGSTKTGPFRASTATKLEPAGNLWFTVEQ